MRSVFATAVIATLSQAVEIVPTNGDIDIDYLYAEHMTKYGLSYSSVEEYETRKARFAEVDTLIRNHNSQEGVTYTLGHNKFSDWSAEERTSLTGIKRKEAGTLGSGGPAGSLATFDTTSLPARVNWNAQGKTTPIQDQGQCGSCWAFMATGTVESAWHIMGGDLYDLSEQQLVDCVTTTQGSWGCYGAYLDAAYVYYMDGVQPTVNADYPYTASDETCVTDKPATPVQVTTWNSITSKDGEQIKGALNQGPIGVSLVADCNDFYNYASGVFTGGDCPNTMSELDHAVQLIGYGSELSSGQEYLLLKNSWGTTWGMDGYMRIGYNATGNGVNGVNLEPIIPITSNYHANAGAFETFSGLTTFVAATLALALSF